MTTIYGDVLFAVNFSMDYIGLLITSRLIGRRPAPGRSLLAAAFGGVFGVCSCFLRQKAYIAILGAAVCLVMCAIAFGLGRPLFRIAPLYLGVSALMGGVMTFLYSMAGVDPAAAGASPGLSLFCMVAFLGCGIAAAFSHLLNRTPRLGQAEVRVRHGTRSVTLTAMLDSGNLLHDLNGDCAMVVKYSTVRALLPSAVRQAVDTGDSGCLALLSPRDKSRLTFLFAASPAGRKMLFGFRPDEITYRGAPLRCVLALDPTEGDFSGCDAVLSPTVL